jgi:hypothetical protein
MSFNPPVLRAHAAEPGRPRREHSCVRGAAALGPGNSTGAPGTVLTDAAITAALRGLYQATRTVPARPHYTATVRNARQIICEYDQHRDATD